LPFTLYGEDVHRVVVDHALWIPVCSKVLSRDVGNFEVSANRGLA
jgi:hypothetical protein